MFWGHDKIYGSWENQKVKRSNRFEQLRLGILWHPTLVQEPLGTAFGGHGLPFSDFPLPPNFPVLLVLGGRYRLLLRDIR